MAASLILNKRITTTVAKAKALRKYVEPLITKAKKDETHSRREVFSHLQNKVAVTELFREVSAKVGERPGGYTRILRTGFRIGDAAEMCVIELVDFNDNYSQNKGAKRAKVKATRRGRGTAKKADTVEQPEKNTGKIEEIGEIEEIEEVVEEPIAEVSVQEDEEQPEEVVPEIIGEQPEEVVVAEVEEPIVETPAEEEEK